MKRIIALAIAACLMFLMAACGSITGTETEKATGEWEINNENGSYSLPYDVNKAFEKATEKYAGSTFEPVAYIGSQVVAGKNHMILCKETTASEVPEISYKVVIIYEDLNGNAEITSVSDFDIEDYIGEGGSDPGMLDGGWSVPEETGEAELPEHALDVYHAEIDNINWVWDTCTPIALLGTQAESGTRYAFLSKGYTDDAINLIVNVIYEEAEDIIAIENTHIIDPADFAQ